MTSDCTVGGLCETFMSVEYMKVLALRWCFASGSQSGLPSCTATASSLSIRHVFLMISQKVCEVTMELCHLYSLLDKFHETLRLSLPSLNVRKARSQKKITIYLKTDICLVT